MAVMLRKDVDELKTKSSAADTKIENLESLISVKKNAQGTITEMKLFGKILSIDSTTHAVTLTDPVTNA